MATKSQARRKKSAVGRPKQRWKSSERGLRAKFMTSDKRIRSSEQYF
jgi:hypothetical protein